MAQHQNGNYNPGYSEIKPAKHLDAAPACTHTESCVVNLFVPFDFV